MLMHTMCSSWVAALTMRFAWKETTYKDNEVNETYQKMLTTLQRYCKEKKMTVYALAKATGLSTSSLSNLLKGNTKPYVYTLAVEFAKVREKITEEQYSYYISELLTIPEKMQ